MKKESKTPKLPPWFTKDVIEAMATRDRLKKKTNLKITKNSEIVYRA